MIGNVCLCVLEAASSRPATAPPVVPPVVRVRAPQGRIADLAARFESAGVRSAAPSPALHRPIMSGSTQRGRAPTPPTRAHAVTPVAGSARSTPSRSPSFEHKYSNSDAGAVNPCEEGRAFTAGLELLPKELIVRTVSLKDPSLGMTSQFFSCRKPGCGLTVCLGCSARVDPADRASHTCEETFEDKVDELYEEVVALLAKV